MPHLCRHRLAGRQAIQELRLARKVISFGMTPVREVTFAFQYTRSNLALDHSASASMRLDCRGGYWTVADAGCVIEQILPLVFRLRELARGEHYARKGWFEWRANCESLGCMAHTKGSPTPSARKNLPLVMERVSLCRA